MFYMLDKGKVKHKFGNMSKLCSKNRRESTTVRDNEIHGMYREIMAGFGEAAGAVSRTYVYGKIHERTKLSVRTISFILNHTEPTC